MQLYQSDFMIISYHAENNMFDYKWLAQTQHMNEDEYRRDVLEYVALVEKYHPLRVILDDSEMAFPIAVHLQEWLGTEVFPRAIAAGLRRLAILVSKDFIAQLGTEQAVETNPDPDTLTTFFFDNRADAIKWLMG